MSEPNKEPFTPQGAGIGVAIGAGVGTALGVALHDFTLGVAFGTVIGAAMMFAFSRKTKSSNEGGRPSKDG